MATLHVRNVPDDLYGLLRERAAENDRSIGAETVQLLQEHFGARRRRLATRRRGGGLFSRFSPPARQAVVTAQEEARALGHGHVGTEHLLLGVIAQAPGLADLTPEDVRAQLEPGDAHPTGRIPFTPSAKQALELALRAALSRGDTAIEPRHLLVGITSTSSRGCELVRGVKVEVGWPPPAAPDPAFRVILLDGDAEAWEKQLNDAAELGYELVEIVDKRAILRR
jgi:antitoxin FitA-like protein/ClpA/ClpB-like protein